MNIKVRRIVVKNLKLIELIKGGRNFLYINIICRHMLDLKTKKSGEL